MLDYKDILTKRFPLSMSGAEIVRINQYTILENRCEACKSTIVCSQREPNSWKSMVLNDEISANSIMKRATRHYTVVINVKNG